MNEILKLITCSIWGHEVDIETVNQVAEGLDIKDKFEGTLMYCQRCERLREGSTFVIFEKEYQRYYLVEKWYVWFMLAGVTTGAILGIVTLFIR